MLVGFWSPYQGASGSTVNAASVALCAAFKNKLRVLIGHTGTTEHVLEHMLFPKRQVSQSSQHYAEVGLETLIRVAKNGLLESENITNYTLPILKQGRLDYLNGFLPPLNTSLSPLDLSRQTRTMDFHSQAKAQAVDLDAPLLIKILECARQAYDIVLVDLDNGLKSPMTAEILAYLDLVIVSSGQNHSQLAALKDHLAPIQFKQAPIICIGRYHYQTKYHLKAIQKRYQINEIGCIPENSGLIDPINDGNLVEFFGRNCLAPKFETAQLFFSDVAKVTDQLLKTKRHYKAR